MTGEAPSRMRELYGVVVNDKPADSTEIEVFLSEQFPLTHGKVADFKPTYKSTTKNIQGTPLTAEAKGSVTVKARWRGRGDGGNRKTAPDVYRNETVTVYSYGDTEEYFWDKVGSEPALRGLEDVLYSYCGRSKLGAGRSLETDYWVRWNPKGGFVQLHTSQANGEVTSYDLKIDALRGQVTLSDGLGNQITLDSRSGALKLSPKTQVEIPVKLVVQGEVTVQGNVVVQGTVTAKDFIEA